MIKKILSRKLKITQYIFSWVTIYTYSGLIIYLSLMPDEYPPLLIFPFSDKVLHGIAYMLLSFVACNTFSLLKKNRPKFYGFVYSFTLGLSMEAIQYFLPYRQFEAADIASNLLGSIFGCLVRII